MLTSGHGPLDDRIFYKEVLTLKKEYNDITIIAQSDREYNEIGGVKIIGIPVRKNHGLKNRIETLVQLYKKGIEAKADVYHCHEPDALYIGYKLKKRLNSMLIYDSHEYHPETFALHFKGIAKQVIKKLVYWFEGYLARKCNYIITVNRILVSKFKKYNKHVLNLPNYPRLSIVKPFIGDEVACKDLRGLVYAGGISSDKGCIKILEAINKSRNNSRMTFIGKAGSEFGNAAASLLGINGQLPFPLEKQKFFIGGSCKNNCENTVEFTGVVEHKNVFELLKRNIIGFVLLQPVDPVDANCQPIKLFEYMACGLAVIAGDYPLIKEIVGDERCGLLVNPSDENEVAAAIDYMLENVEETLKMGERGRQAVMEKHNWESIENGLLNIYKYLSGC